MRSLSLYDQAERKKQEGMELSYRNADTAWKRAAAKRVYYLARTRKTFTSDDVIMYLDKKGIVTGNNSALGAIMQSSQRAGLINATGHFIESKRPSRHMAPLRIWESNIWGNKRG